MDQPLDGSANHDVDCASTGALPSAKPGRTGKAAGRGGAAAGGEPHHGQRGGEESSLRGRDWAKVVAGAVSGGLSRMVIAPLDVVKIRLQLQPQQRGQRGYYTSTLAAFRRIVQDEGVTALWRGNTPAVALYVSYAAVQFPVYARASAAAERWGVPHSSAQFLGGVVGACAATAATFPFDWARTRMAGHGLSSGVTLRAVLGELGQLAAWPRVFAALPAALLQIAPAAGLSFLSYDWCKSQLLATVDGMQTASPFQLGLAAALAGSAAGCVSKLAVYPLDTIKRRVQAAGLSRRGELGRLRHGPDAGAWAVALEMLEHEGARAFFRGAVPGVLKTTLNTGLTFCVYELVVELLRQPALSSER